MVVHQNELRQLREVKAAMQQQLANLMAAPIPPPASTPTPTPASAPARKALPFNHIFDGDETMFKSWHTAITSKLRSDAAFIGNDEQQWFVINEMLAMQVRRRVAPEYNHGPAANYNPAHFLEYLELIYNDSKAADRARTEL
ncbi:hypothetical protein E4U22_008604 [Claviceps purpurea]|nr:hypothetical protein E4U22_008604 [Claviceps purpurea]